MIANHRRDASVAVACFSRTDLCLLQGRWRDAVRGRYEDMDSVVPAGSIALCNCPALSIMAWDS